MPNPLTNKRIIIYRNCESRYTVCSLPTLKGFSGYQCPWNLSRRAFSSSSPNILTRRLGNLLYRYEMTKFKATCISICILLDIICNLMPSSSFPLFFLYTFSGAGAFFLLCLFGAAFAAAADGVVIGGCWERGVRVDFWQRFRFYVCL